MKPEEINEAIAEACTSSVPNGGWNMNFHGSLDAMAEARKTLKGIEPLEYAYWLLKILGIPIRNVVTMGELHAVANATASQHAEAFLRAKEIWKETHEQ